MENKTNCLIVDVDQLQWFPSSCCGVRLGFLHNDWAKTVDEKQVLIIRCPNCKTSYRCP